jgi:predicted HicB family RNase H-like nuclease
MARPPKDGESAVVVRMPTDLHLALKAKAAADERSVAQAIRFALRKHVEEGG